NSPAVGSLLDRLAIGGLRAYQRFLSPHKGFRCAYGVAYGSGSCSDVAMRLARRFGALGMVSPMPLQAARCRRALGLLRAAEPPRRRWRRAAGCADLARGAACDAITTSCVDACPWPWRRIAAALPRRVTRCPRRTWSCVRPLGH